MELPLQVTFRDVPASEAISMAVREKAAKLDRFYRRIMGCRVTIESPHRHQHKGKIYRVRIDLTVPGHKIVVGRDRADHGAHQDVYVAIRNAFNAARRQLQTYIARRRHHVKHHNGAEHAWIAKLLPNDEYGFIHTADGREIYFHKNSVLGNKFDRLDVGTEVRFAEEAGDKGPQATTIELVGRNGTHVIE